MVPGERIAPNAEPQAEASGRNRPTATCVAAAKQVPGVGIAPNAEPQAEASDRNRPAATCFAAAKQVPGVGFEPTRPLRGSGF